MLSARYPSFAFPSLLLAGVAVGMWYWAPPQFSTGLFASPAKTSSEPSAPIGDQRYSCPMHANIVQDHPGTCPICGMALVSVAHAHDSTVAIDAATQQALGVRLAAAQPRIVARNVSTYGKVVIDQGGVSYVAPKFEGWIRKINVKAVGERVRAGDVLYELYSADLIARQSDYLKLQERRRQLLKLQPQADGSKESELVMDLMQERTRSRTRMVYEDISPDMLKELEDLKQPMLIVPVRAPKSGVVTEIAAREGSFVAPEGKILALAALNEVWLDIVLYEDQLASVREGDAMTVTFPSLPGVTTKGEVKWSSPLLDETTRTANARLTLRNADGRLRPGMYADVTIETQKARRLSVPRSAVMHSGAGDYVMRHDSDGKFAPVAVTVGIESEHWSEIAQGLTAGDEVAANGQFLLAAESSLADARERMSRGMAAHEGDETPQ